MSLLVANEVLPDLSTVSISEDVPESRNADPSPPFLWEIWEMILQPLTSQQLLPVRLTCHRLKEIVDSSPKTAGKFKITFSRGLRVDRNYEPEDLYAASRVSFWQPTILEVGPWWHSLAEDLVQIDMRCCSVAFPALFEMLSRAVNLRQLELSDMSYEGGVSVESSSFVLDGVEELKLSGESTQWPLFGKMCPRLKEVSICCNHEDIGVHNIVELVEAVQDTLTAITVVCAGHNCLMKRLLSEIGELSRLKLRRAVLRWDGIVPRQLMDFGRAQPLVSDLEVKNIRNADMINEMLHEILQHFPKLNRFHVSIRFPYLEPLSFINSMTELEDLTLVYDDYRGYDSEVVVTNGKSSKLKNIQIFCLKPVLLNGLEQFLANCPNIRCVTLSNCHIQGWSNVFVPNYLKFLQKVELYYVMVKDGFGTLSVHDRSRYQGQFAVGEYPNLTSLLMIDCSMDVKELTTLFNSNLNLEEIQILYMDVTDEIIHAICTKQKNMRKLIINRSRITDLSAKHITAHCRSLQYLDFRFNHLTFDARECLRNMSSGDERFTFLA